MNTILKLEHIQKYYGNEEMCIRDRVCNSCRSSSTRRRFSCMI